MEHLIIDAKILQGNYLSLLRLKNVDKLHIVGTTKTQNKTILSLKKLLKASKKYNYTKTQDKLLFNLVVGHKTIEKLSTKQVYTVIQSHLNDLVYLALAELSKRLKAQQNINLTANSKIVLDGKLNTKVSDLKNRLSPSGINIGKKIDSSTSHILIGKHPTSKFLSSPYILLTEALLLEWLNTNNTPYLLTSKEHHTDNIRALLQSTDSENISLALEILRSGGTPQSLKEELFFFTKQIRQQPSKRQLYKCWDR